MNETYHALIGKASVDLSWWQMSIRGLIVFAYSVLLVRLVGRRIFGRRAAIDIILAVLIGSSLSRTLTGNAPLVATLAATTAVIAVYWLLARLAYRWKPVARLLKGRSETLVEDGEVREQTARKYAITESELREALRRSDVKSLASVDTAYLENNGAISIFKKG